MSTKIYPFSTKNLRNSFLRNKLSNCVPNRTHAATLLPGRLQRGQGPRVGGLEDVAEVVPQRKQLLHHEVDLQGHDEAALEADDAVALHHQGHHGGKGRGGGGGGKGAGDYDVKSVKAVIL